MDERVKIHIEYYFKCEHNLSEQLKSFKQILNMRGKSFVTQFRFLPLDYIEENRLCNNDYLLLDNVILIPNLHTGETSYNTSKILLVDLIHYTEESYNWVIKEISNLRFSKAADDNYPNKHIRITTNESLTNSTNTSYSDVKSGENEMEKTDKSEKKQWNSNKSEFAKFVNEEYEKDNKHQKYSSLRDASNKLFGQYQFEDKNWTEEQCYGLVRKN